METSIHKIKITALLSFLFFTTTIFFGWLTGVATPGNYFSPHVALRLQTEAFLQGRISLSDNIVDLDEDMVWHEGKVSQVWGLGVPLLRTPFEVIARICGFSAFPDRVTFLFYVFLTTYILFLGVGSFLQKYIKKSSFISFVLVMVAIFFPAFISLARTRFIVYEEVIAYGYLYALVVFGCSLLFIRYKSLPMLYGLAVLSSAALFIRPTVFVYTSLVFFALVFFTFFSKCLSKKQVYIALVFFIGTCSLFFLSNKFRFGSFFEFGHTLNVASNPSMLNITRFPSGYKESNEILSKINDTLAFSFLLDTVPKRNYVFSSGMHPWQFELLRWRFIYFPVFSFYYFLPIALLFLILFFSLSKKKYDSIFLYTAVGLLSLVALFIFYAQNTFISSRYFVDMSASLYTSIFVCFMFFLSQKRVAVAFLFLVFIMLVQVSDIRSHALSVTRHKNFIPISFEGVSKLLQKKKTSCEFVGSFYEKGRRQGCVHPFNRVGWNIKTGEIKDTLSFLVFNPQEISLQFVLPHNTSFTYFWDMKAKLGTEYLSVEDVVWGKNNTVLVNFSKPQDKKNTKKIQTLFIQTRSVSDVVPKEKILLEKISWD